MYNFEMNEKKKNNILKNVNLSNRERKIFNLLTKNIPRKEIPLYIKCSLRTIHYDIEKIAKKINEYETGKEYLNYSVYIHIFPNGKKYVGVTEHTRKRWGSSGIPYSKNIEMYEDIIKYGWDNIKHEILLTTTNSFKARELEKKLIKIFDLTNNKKGYNKTI